MLADVPRSPLAAEPGWRHRRPTMYTPEEHAADKERILEALDAILKLREEYKDVIAIPEVITLHDITEYHIDAYNGAAPFKKILNRAAATYVLDYFSGVDFVTPEHFEHTIICALQDYKTRKK
jgi:hypothetical protein